MTAYFDCVNGAAGDMIVAALLDAGASLESLQAGLGTLKIDGYELHVHKVNQQGLQATRFDVKLTRPQTHHRHLRQIVSLIRAASISVRVQDQACRIFERLAQVEAEVHGCAIDEVHFHEVGAVDAVIDIVGACLALEQLQIERVICSPIPVGSGTVSCDHGVLPIPAPATAALLVGVPVADSDETGELTTPTGAAILTTWAETFRSIPSMTLRRIGYGAGARPGRTRPNVLRVLIGEELQKGGSEEVVVLETNIDDQSPELLAHTAERLMEQGALDVTFQPIIMKKGRPATTLSVMCRPDQVEQMEALIFSETTTFGVRRSRWQRTTLERTHQTVVLAEGTVRIKIGSQGERIFTAAPEFEDCRRLAEETGMSVKQVMAEAMVRWHQDQHKPE